MKKPSEQFREWEAQDRPVGVYAFPVFDLLDQLWAEAEKLKADAEANRGDGK